MMLRSTLERRALVLCMLGVFGVASSACSFTQDWAQYQGSGDGGTGMDGSIDLPDGEVPPGDGGDAGPGDDGGPMEDSGPPPACIGDIDCNDSIDCTVDQCLDNVCSNTPEDTMCTAAAGGSCEDDGCQYPMCTGATCTAGPCETAACDGDTCERTSTCDSGEMCCGGACAAAGCDDGNPCTIDSCGASGCENVPVDSMCDDSNPCTDDVCGATACEYTDNSASCDDGVFCNGADTCGGGSCGGHAGDPCPGASVCDEGASTCTGCAGRSDCPPDITGTFGACGYDDSCDESATRSRMDTSYACVSGTCEPTETTVNENCVRDTEDDTCGSSSCDPSFGTCTFTGGTCDETGTQSRGCTDRLCRGGSCSNVARTETVGCMRDTDTLDCGGSGGLSCPGYSACSGFSNDCDETGTQTRTCTQTTCDGGSCSDSRNVPQSDSCTRPSTDGDECGTLSCPGWGTCGFANTCTANGTQSRNCSQPLCNAGSCSSSVSQTQNQGCGRPNRDGVECGTESCPAFGGCLREEEICMGEQSRTCTTPICADNSCSSTSNRRETEMCCDAGGGCGPGGRDRCFGCFCEPLCGDDPC